MTIGLTSVAGYVSSSWLADRQTVRTEQIARINKFLSSGEEFEPLIKAHMRNLLDGKSSSKSAEALTANIQAQHIQLDAVRAYVPLELRFESDSYANILVATDRAVKKAKDPLTAGPLMQAANDAVVEKGKLDSALREGAGLPK